MCIGLPSRRPAMVGRCQQVFAEIDDQGLRELSHHRLGVADQVFESYGEVGVGKFSLASHKYFDGLTPEQRLPHIVSLLRALASRGDHVERIADHVQEDCAREILANLFDVSLVLRCLLNQVMSFSLAGKRLLVKGKQNSHRGSRSGEGDLA